MTEVEMMVRSEFIKAVLGFARAGLARVALLFGVCAALLAWPLPAAAVIVLNPNDPLANFVVDPPGSIKWTPGAQLVVTDDSPSDFVYFYGADPDAAPGIDLDLVASFQVLSSPSGGVDSGLRFVINAGGLSKAAIACCVTKGGIRGIGLAVGTNYSTETNYPDVAFVPVDWTGPTSFRLRRTANNTAELVEINGAPPQTPRVLDSLPHRVREFASVEFGCMSVEAVTTALIARVETQRVTTGVDDPDPASSVLAMRVVTRSPGAGGQLRVEFALRDGSPARLEMMDVAGRVVTAMQVGMLGPGTHTLDLSEGIALRSGIYFLRLAQGGSEVRARAAVIR